MQSRKGISKVQLQKTGPPGGIELGAVQAANASTASLAPLSIPSWPRELQELVLVPSHATSPDLLLHPGHTTNHEYLQ